MKVDVDCTIRSGEAEIGISVLERVSRQEFDEYVDTLRREGFKYEPYEKSHFFRTRDAKMLSAMLRFLDKEFEVSATLRGKGEYSWDQREEFVKELVVKEPSESGSGQ